MGDCAGSSPVTRTIIGKPKRYLGKKPRNHAVFCISKGWILKMPKRGCKNGLLALRQDVSFQETCKTQDGPTFQHEKMWKTPGNGLNTRFFRGKPLEWKRKFCNLAKWDCKIFLPTFGPKMACTAQSCQLFKFTF